MSGDRTEVSACISVRLGLWWITIPSGYRTAKTDCLRAARPQRERVKTRSIVTIMKNTKGEAAISMSCPNASRVGNPGGLIFGVTAPTKILIRFAPIKQTLAIEGVMFSTRIIGSVRPSVWRRSFCIRRLWEIPGWLIMRVKLIIQRPTQVI